MMLAAVTTAQQQQQEEEVKVNVSAAPDADRTEKICRWYRCTYCYNYQQQQQQCGSSEQQFTLLRIRFTQEMFDGNIIQNVHGVDAQRRLNQQEIYTIMASVFTSAPRLFEAYVDVDRNYSVVHASLSYVPAFLHMLRHTGGSLPEHTSRYMNKLRHMHERGRSSSSSSRGGGVECGCCNCSSKRAAVASSSTSPLLLPPIVDHMIPLCFGIESDADGSWLREMMHNGLTLSAAAAIKTTTRTNLVVLLKVAKNTIMSVLGEYLNVIHEEDIIIAAAAAATSSVSNKTTTTTPPPPLAIYCQPEFVPIWRCTINIMARDMFSSADAADACSLATIHTSFPNDNSSSSGSRRRQLIICHNMSATLLADWLEMQMYHQQQQQQLPFVVAMVSEFDASYLNYVPDIICKLNAYAAAVAAYCDDDGIITNGSSNDGDDDDDNAAAAADDVDEPSLFGEEIVTVGHPMSHYRSFTRYVSPKYSIFKKTNEIISQAGSKKKLSMMTLMPPPPPSECSSGTAAAAAIHFLDAFTKSVGTSMSMSAAAAAAVPVAVWLVVVPECLQLTDDIISEYVEQQQQRCLWNGVYLSDNNTDKTFDLIVALKTPSLSQGRAARQQHHHYVLFVGSSSRGICVYNFVSLVEKVFIVVDKAAAAAASSPLALVNNRSSSCFYETLAPLPNYLCHMKWPKLSSTVGVCLIEYNNHLQQQESSSSSSPSNNQPTPPPLMPNSYPCILRRRSLRT